ncbi:MAG: DUF1501 domain-containing protein, partial [Gaiellaceae bacterium]
MSYGKPQRRHDCAEHTRSELLRRASAEAGRGLPIIEPGTPLPAGTGLDRRTFLAGAAGLVLTVYGAGRLGNGFLDDGIANAAANGATTEPILVSVFLDGGIDSLSLLYPGGDGEYHRLRPQLGLAPELGTPFSEDPRLLWHPLAAPFATLHGEGKLSVAPAIGYASPDQSHFTSRHYYEVGATDANLRTGWLGRYLDHAGSVDNPLQGLSLDYALQPSLASKTAPVAAISAPDEYQLWSRNVWGDVRDRMLGSLADIGQSAQGKDPGLSDAGQVLMHVDGVRRQLLPFIGEDEEQTIVSPVAYPASDDSFPERLAGLAAMLGAGLPLKCVALTAPGAYDTHDNQVGAFEQGLELTAASLLAFQRDLEARGLADRVLT